MSNREYAEELEKIIIFLCDVYTKGADSLACQENDKGEVDDKWMNVFMTFPTIQGMENRIYVEKIGKLRTLRSNREAPKIGFKELYENIKSGRKELGSHPNTKENTNVK